MNNVSTDTATSHAIVTHEADGELVEAEILPATSSGISIPAQLTHKEKERLGQQEDIIQRGLRNFIDVGNALKAIRDERLYRGSHQTFEDYCRERWEFVARRGYQLIDAAQVAGNLNNCSQKPSNEAQVRPLTYINSADHQQEAWIRATGLAQGKAVTKQLVEQAVVELKPTWRVAKKAAKGDEKNPKSVAKFNRTGSRVDWAWWTWNPIEGKCQHNCYYCYATNLKEHRKLHGAPTEDALKPRLVEDRLIAPLKTPIPVDEAVGAHLVFVCSTNDLFGSWVKDEWINAIFKAIKDGPQEWTYLLLTKNPGRMVEFVDKFPPNVWLGATIDGISTTPNTVKATEDAFQKLKAKRPELIRFVSCEPLLAPVCFSDLTLVNWLIIGCQSAVKGHLAQQPDGEWVANLLVQARESGCQVYCKPNLLPTVWPRESPTAPSVQFETRTGKQTAVSSTTTNPSPQAVSRRELVFRLLAAHDEGYTLLQLMCRAFLLSRRSDALGIPYTFTPHPTGPYSFLLQHDLEKSIDKGLLRQSSQGQYTLTDAGRESITASTADKCIQGNIEACSAASDEALLNEVFNISPWLSAVFADRAQRRESLQNAQHNVYTVGYEKLELDQFFEMLLKTGIQQIVDLRDNPIYRGFGYHKSTLKTACNEVGITYISRPDLGVPATWRNEAKDTGNYQAIFDRFEQEKLPTLSTEIRQLANLILSKPTTLLCYEHYSRDCHRIRIANALCSITGLLHIDVRNAWEDRQST